MANITAQSASPEARELCAQIIKETWEIDLAVDQKRWKAALYRTD